MGSVGFEGLVRCGSGGGVAIVTLSFQVFMWVVSRTGNVSRMFLVFHSLLGVRFISCCHGVRQGP